MSPSYIPFSLSLFTTTLLLLFLPSQLIIVVGDLYLYKLSEILFGDSVAKWTVSYDFSHSLFFLLLYILCTAYENLTLSQLFRSSDEEGEK